MPPQIDPALAEALDAGERDALARALADDPALQGALHDWSAARRAVARDLADGLPDSSALALFAIESGAPEALGEEDLRELAASRAAVDAALARHPALGHFVNRLAADAAAFDASWSAAQARPGYLRVVPAADRPAARPANVTVLWRRVGRIAAVVALVSLASLAALLLRRDAGLEHVVAEGPVTIDLADGSTVELAAGAELFYPEAPGRDPEAVSGDAPDGARRYARLAAGRALFRVARSTEPFLVETPSASVTVLGTTFGVHAAGRETEVVLVSGEVEVAARGGGESVRLAPGQYSRVDATEGASPAAHADLDAALAWTGDIYLRGETLASAVSRIGAAFGVTVEVDPALATEAVSGTFDRAEGIDATLRALALAIDGRVEGSAGHFRIVPAAD